MQTDWNTDVVLLVVRILHEGHNKFALPLVRTFEQGAWLGTKDTDRFALRLSFGVVCFFFNYGVIVVLLVCFS